MIAILTGRKLGATPCLQGMCYYGECNGETLAVIVTDTVIEQMHGVRKRLYMWNELIEAEVQVAMKWNLKVLRTKLDIHVCV